MAKVNVTCMEKTAFIFSILFDPRLKEIANTLLQNFFVLTLNDRQP